MKSFRNKIIEWLDKPADNGTAEWFLQRITARVVTPGKTKLLSLRGLPRFFSLLIYRARLFLRSRTPAAYTRSPIDLAAARCLFACSASREGKPYLEKIIKAWGKTKVDYIIFVWDDSSFDEPVFKGCEIVREKGIKWSFMKKYVTPEVCEPYDFILTWDDDIDIKDFSLERFLRIMVRNNLEVAQPALEAPSHINIPLTLKKRNKTGRLTDYTESMAQVFRREAWKQYWSIMEPEDNPWGWGFDTLFRSMCDIRRIGIIDSEPVIHTRAPRENEEAKEAAKRFYKRHPEFKPARFVSFGELK